jgi:hypothetical protein
VEGYPAVVCTPSPPAVRALVAAHEPTVVQVVLSPSQVPEAKLSFIQVVMSQCIPYAMCHGKIAKSFKAWPLELATLGAGLAAPHHRQACLVVKGHRGSISPRLLMPHRRLPSMELSTRRLGHRWLCSPRPLRGGASSLVALGRRFKVPRGLLRAAWGSGCRGSV